MRYKLANKDSIATGFWKKDKYIGLYEKPYMVYKNTIHLTEIACKKVNNSFNQVEIFLTSESGGMISSLTSDPVPKPQITVFEIISGNYLEKK